MQSFKINVDAVSPILEVPLRKRGQPAEKITLLTKSTKKKDCAIMKHPHNFSFHLFLIQFDSV